MALMTATFGVIVLAESSVEPRSLSSSVGFKPHTVVLTPVLQESNGQFTYLNSLKRTGTKELNTGSSGDSFIFMGADRELMEQIHASIDGTDANFMVGIWR